MSELWEVLVRHFPEFRSGFLVTVQLVAVSFAIAMVVGLFVGALRVAPVRWVRWLGGLYVEFFRNVPLLVLLSIAYLGLRRAGIPIGPWVAGTASLGLYTAAYVAETIRSGVSAVGKGQIDAGLSLGFTSRRVLSQIVIPQAVRSVIPPLGSLIIAMIKNSAIIGDGLRPRRRPLEGSSADRLRDVPVQRGVLLGGRRLPAVDGQRDLRGPGTRTTARGPAVS